MILICCISGGNVCLRRVLGFGDISSITPFYPRLKYVQKNASEKELFIVIGGDRGLAGGYNINIFKKVLEETKHIHLV